MLTLLPRAELDADAWNACVAASAQRVIYGYMWYLDAVLPHPDWTWMGLVLINNATYQAVMPIPLRRKLGVWRVHQPLFCQFLNVFRADSSVDPIPFFQFMLRRFRYGSLVQLATYPAPALSFDVVRQLATHVLDLSVGYAAVYQHYSRDRKLNLRRAESAGWTVVESTDPEPLLALFRTYHADQIPGGVADWAYATFRRLYATLQQRGLATLQYALRNGQLEAGALFVQEGNRIVYLFNAASATGRWGNARTLLIDRMIRQQAGRPVVFDFESPEKTSVVRFYQSFGAVPQPFWAVRWNRLTVPERVMAAVLRWLR